MRPLARLAIIMILPLLILAIPALATPMNTITVCSLGCDYAAIQPAIDAASFGDTVVVSAGTYTGQLMLKSGVTLTSTDGPTSTIVTANKGPIISAESMTTTQILGLTIRGSGSVTEPVGIKIIGGELLISHCVIEDMHGQKAPDFEPGVTAYGLYASGVQTLTVDDCVNEPPRGKPRGIRRLTTA